MTGKEFARKMREIQTRHDAVPGDPDRTGDCASIHLEMDALLVELIRDLAHARAYDYDEGLDIFRAQEKWYE